MFVYKKPPGTKERGKLITCKIDCEMLLWNFPMQHENPIWIFIGAEIMQVGEFSTGQNSH